MRNCTPRHKLLDISTVGSDLYNLSNPYYSVKTKKYGVGSEELGFKILHPLKKLLDIGTDCWFRFLYIFLNTYYSVERKMYGLVPICTTFLIPTTRSNNNICERKKKAFYFCSQVRRECLFGINIFFSKTKQKICSCKYGEREPRENNMRVPYSR